MADPHKWKNHVEESLRHASYLRHTIMRGSRIVWVLVYEKLLITHIRAWSFLIEPYEVERAISTLISEGDGQLLVIVNIPDRKGNLYVVLVMIMLIGQVKAARTRIMFVIGNSEAVGHLRTLAHAYFNRDKIAFFYVSKD